MARIAPIQIPKTVSSPADPSAPSFLRTLPPEIRNRVYEALFKRDDEVRLYDKKAYYEQLLQVGFLGSSVFDERHRHRFGDCITLLQTCRQIYHETVGVVYGSNAFRFSQIRGTECFGAFRPQEYASKLLSKIGSHFALLSKVSIDLEICYNSDIMSCDTIECNLDLLPFLRLRWAHCAVRCSLEFVEPFSEPNEQSVQAGSHVDRHYAAPAHVLNNLLVSLGDKDLLKIKRYANFARLIPAVQIFHMGEDIHGTVLYKKESGITKIGRDISILDEGNHVEWNHVEWRAPNSTYGSLSRFPQDVLSLISVYAYTADTDVILDLDARICYGLNMNIMHLCSGLRQWWRHSQYLQNNNLQNNNRFILKTDSTVLDASSLGYSGLKELMAVPIFNVLFFFGFGSVEPRNTVLEVMSRPECSLENVKIDVEAIWRIQPFFFTGFSVVVSQSMPAGETQHTRCDAGMSWKQIQRLMFLLVSEIIRDMPEKAFSPRPKIWIDGTFENLEAVYPATEVATQRIIRLHCPRPNEDDLYNQGLESIRDLERAMHTARKSNCLALKEIADYLDGFGWHTDPKDGSLINMWTTLRGHLWNLWYTGG